MNLRRMVLLAVVALAALLVSWRSARWHGSTPAASTPAGSRPETGEPTGPVRAAPPRFVRRSEPPDAVERATERARLHQELGRWLRGDTRARARALDGFVREADLDSKHAGRLRQLARGAGQTARSLDRLGERTPLPAAALLDDTEAELRWILTEKQWALFCQRVLDQRT
jgi:hypothetical protein